MPSWKSVKHEKGGAVEAKKGAVSETDREDPRSHHEGIQSNDMIITQSPSKCWGPTGMRPTP